MQRIASFIGGTFLIVVLSAAASADDWEVCHTAEGDEAIVACSHLIAGGNLHGHDLVGVYTGRGMARDAKGDFDGAMADYHQAIKIDPEFPIAMSFYVLELAGEAYHRGDYATALRVLRPLADRGNVGAQTNIGQMYENGLGVPQDYTEAARMYRFAADHGFAGAQVLLAWMYISGEGVPRNYAEALRLYHLAADQGDADAQKALGLSYFNGIYGVPQSFAEAAGWYTLAADQGEALAQSELGILYANGQGVRQDYVRAHMWFNLSAAQGNQKALKDRDRIAGRMTREQIAEAQKLAREWKPKSKR
jgi:tetratricopeptide (TPR) repeat protein